MENKSIFLGFAIPDEVANQIFQHDKNPAIQTHKFGWSFISALTQFTSPLLLSAVPVSNYPSNKRMFFNGGRFREKNCEGIYIPFINILVIKHLSRFFAALFILAFYFLTQKIKNIYVHGVHSPYLILCYFFSFFGIKYHVILTDPAGVILPGDSKITQFLKRIDKNLVGYFIRNADTVICLSPYLVKHYQINLTYIIFPGILNNDFSRIVDSTKMISFKNTKDKIFKITYAGGLHEAYGIKLLVDAIVGLNSNIPIQLLLYGKGDQVDYIKEKSLSDSRIKYMGFCETDELVPALLNSDLLVNPRPSHQEFATLSFPSKLIEYLYTGIPVLTTRIKSIPADYEEHFFYIDDESVTGIQDALLNIIQLPEKIRLQKAHRAAIFIKNNASEEAIGNKLKLMI
ncbi:glycosyltransferase [Acinetobacter indicus]|uniref:glycosyltransferase n=1 Tax=Acinetobacter indicus TaxID=756892 RepID=UPI0034D5F4F1